MHQDVGPLRGHCLGAQHTSSHHASERGALAMESWPARSRGFMSGVLQGSWGLGFALSAAAYGLLYSPLEAWHKGYGWRGMLILGVLPVSRCRLD